MTKNQTTTTEQAAFASYVLTLSVEQLYTGMLNLLVTATERKLNDTERAMYATLNTESMSR